MRRFRMRRRRVAAGALLPLAALITTTAFADAPASTGENARIDASSRSVAFGEGVTLRGVFPGAHKASIEIRHRARGAKVWRIVGRARTGARGRYSVRVKPRRNGYWRAGLSGTATPHAALTGGEPAGDPAAASSSAIDSGTGTERISVRSRTVAAVSDRHTLAGRTVKVRGMVTPAGAERRVVVQIGNAREVTRAGRNGKFDVAWRAPGTGTYPVRVRARSNRVATGSHDSAGRITVYRPAAASWYGPGLYGNAMACGGTLTPSTLGVAHRTLPCGTKLRLRYGNRTVPARVVDRGPFAGNREFDLTSATKQALGFGDVGTVLTSK